ncbi:hypothetical protein DENIS_2755 [Desulfonema ishimotonii]|uniref:histidine kinase n=2 Tax=Desulfonema ishimotonii TaxID=45657 RepID=A0A401FXY4_9BACT|nr:hypothetical protein DENIS_2755 [Desulfonema ishimotonii]
MIDDDKDIRQRFRNILEKHGYEISEAENGLAGLEMVRENQPDLVIVGLQMQDSDGLDVLKKISAISAGTPIIAVAGSRMASTVAEAFRLGAWDCLLRPVADLSVLPDTVKKVLVRARLIHEKEADQTRMTGQIARLTEGLNAADAEIDQINRRLQQLVKSTRDLSVCVNVNQFGARLLEEFGRHMSATGGSLYLAEKNGLRLVHTLDPGHAPAFIPYPIRSGSIFQRALAEGQPILINDVKSCGSLATSGWYCYRNGSVLAFPIPDETGRVSGILSLHNKKEPPFIEQDKKIGTILASYSCEALKASRATEALQESEEKFRSISASAHDAIIMADSEGKISFWNPAAEKILGYSCPEAIGKNLCDLIAPEEYRGAYEALLRHPPDTEKKKLVRKNSEMTALKKNMTRISVEQSVSSVKLGGKWHLVSFIRDISERLRTENETRRLEARLRQTQKMESLGTLAGGIAHDFNNILTSIVGYTELTLNDLSENRRAAERLRAVLKAGERARDLVRQILTFSRMSDQPRTPIQIHLIVTEALKLLRSSLPVTIAIRENITDSGQLLADPTQIHQVLINLCTNACHAMQKTGGTLTVTLRPVTLEQHHVKKIADLAPGPYVKLMVSDTGHGIPGEIMDCIFDPYFTTKKKGKGIGLGLAVVHGIVKSHKGAITVESTPGEGTVFSIYHPAIQKECAIPIARKAEMPMGTERILVVDDEKDIALLEQQMLEYLGYRVTAFTSSIEALRNFRSDPDRFDAVLTDMTMPGMTGDRLAREMLKIRPDIPVILCTGFSENMDRARAAVLGIKKFIMKPVLLSDMAVAVQEVLK